MAPLRRYYPGETSPLRGVSPGGRPFSGRAPERERPLFQPAPSRAPKRAPKKGHEREVSTAGPIRGPHLKRRGQKLRLNVAELWALKPATFLHDGTPPATLAQL